MNLDTVDRPDIVLTKCWAAVKAVKGQPKLTDPQICRCVCVCVNNDVSSSVDDIFVRVCVDLYAIMYVCSAFIQPVD